MPLERAKSIDDLYEEVEGYGGEVWVEDNEPKGTVVTVQLREGTTPA